MSRRAILALVAAIAVASAGLGWVAGQRIKSPADIAAEALPPKASLITVPVEQRVLSSNVVIRGQVEFSESADLSVSGSADGVAIITRLPKAEGEDLNEGDVAVEVAGRPMLVLQGELPTFRSLTPTLEGPDVRQLEDALVRLGLDPGPVDGLYDSRTESAVTELYRLAGYNAKEPTAEELERVEIARRTVRSERQAVSEAERNSNSGLPASTRLELDRSVSNAEDAYNAAIAERDSAVGESWALTTVAREALAQAKATADTATSRLAAAQAGSHPDTGQPPTPDELAELQQVQSEAASALTLAISDEKNAVAAEAAIKAEHDPMVANAKVDFEIAKASRSEAISDSGNSGAGERLSQARQALTEAQNNLNRLEAETGVVFPASELIFLPTLPSAVQALRVDIGDVPQGAVMTVTGSGVKITSTVSAADRSLLNEGDEAIMEDDDLGISAAAVIAFVADNPGGVDVAADRYVVRLEPVGELPEDAINQNLRITIPFASSDGEVLAVPLAALSAGADGSSRVEVERSDGTVETVKVAPGLNARALGLVEITPVDGELAAGDRVVVGRDVPTPAQPSDTEPSDTEETDAEDSETEDSDGGG